MNVKPIALLPVFAVMAACASPDMPDSPYPAQRAYFAEVTMAEHSDVAVFLPSQHTVLVDAMPAGLENDSWSLVQPEEPQEEAIAPLAAAAPNACPQSADEKIAQSESTKQTRPTKAAKPRHMHKLNKTVSCIR